MPSAKTEIIRRLFEQRWDAATGELSDPVVTLAQVSDAIKDYNARSPSRTLSDRNPANFFKDLIRHNASANANWPREVFAAAYTGRQETAFGNCFRFVPVAPHQSEPFPENAIPPPSEATPRHQIESASLPLASRRLGRPDESWLIQVLVRLRVVETHLALMSPRRIVQVDPLQMSVKLRQAEVDAVYLAVGNGTGDPAEYIVSCEAKGLRDSILPTQVMQQVRALFRTEEITQAAIIPLAAKVIGPSRVHLVEFDAVGRSDARTFSDLTIASEAVYEFVPPVPGIGGRVRRRAGQ